MKAFLFAALLWAAPSANDTLITDNSIGKAKLGDSLDNLHKSYGKELMSLAQMPDAQTGKNAVPFAKIYASADLKKSDTPAVSARFGKNKRVEAICALDKTFKTKAGLHIGSLLGDLKQKTSLKPQNFILTPEGTLFVQIKATSYQLDENAAIDFQNNRQTQLDAAVIQRICISGAP